jgi:hypothetical protein
LPGYSRSSLSECARLHSVVETHLQLALVRGIAELISA